jgi:hypothetical protein
VLGLSSRVGRKGKPNMYARPVIASLTIHNADIGILASDTSPCYLTDSLVLES